jgi:hypothetical protein
VKVYVRILEENPGDWKVRNALRNFLTTIPVCDEVANVISATFSAELLIYTTTVSGTGLYGIYCIF